MVSDIAVKDRFVNALQRPEYVEEEMPLLELRVSCCLLPNGPFAPGRLALVPLNAELVACRTSGNREREY